MLKTFRLIAGLTLVAAAQFAPQAMAQSKAVATPASGACPATLNHTFARLQDEKPQSLCQYSGKVLLVVNTASYCGFTPQYEGLEALHEKYKGKGLVVLGFPSNDFAQEKSNNKDIADFCQNTYGVKFPMFAKTAVRGSDVNAFYRQLAQATGKAPEWNFHKYLIGRDGKILAHYPSRTTPQDPALVAAIEKQLAAP
jgi:glutathione peroxidase